MGSCGTASHILNLGTRWRSIVGFILQSGKEYLVPMGRVILNVVAKRKSPVLLGI
jgi:hypothetical protein